MKPKFYELFYVLISILIVIFIWTTIIKDYIGGDLEFWIAFSFFIFIFLILAHTLLFLIFYVITEKDNLISFKEATELRDFFIAFSFFISILWTALVYLYLEFNLIHKKYEKPKEYYQIEKEIETINKIERETNKDKILEEENIEKIKNQIQSFENLKSETSNEKILEKINKEIKKLQNKLPKETQEENRTYVIGVSESSVKEQVRNISEKDKQKEIEELKNRIKELENSVN